MPAQLVSMQKTRYLHFFRLVLRPPIANQLQTTLSPVAIFSTIVILNAHLTERNQSGPEVTNRERG